MEPTIRCDQTLYQSSQDFCPDVLKGLPENFAPLLVENIKKGGYTHVVASHSAFGKSLLPRVAAMLDVQQVSDVMSIQSEDSEHSPKVPYLRILTP
jgi:electron transfer flavoprotein alpha subunit